MGGKSRPKINSRAIFRQWYIDHWKRLTEPPGVPKRIDLLPFRFHNWRRPQGWCAAYYKSGFHPGHLPFPGGYDNQPKWVIHDLNVYLRGIAWALGEREDSTEQAKDGQMWHKLHE